MENRRKIEIAVAILVIVLFIGLLSVLLRKEQVEIDNDTPIVTDVKPSKEMRPVDAKDIPPPAEVAAATVTRSFVERFGSYSSETNFINVEDVVPLATAAFADELEDLAESARRTAGDSYYGISTIVLSAKATADTSTRMTFLVMTQREEAIGSPEDTTVRYQNISVDLEKVGDDWRVAAFEWRD